MMPIFTDQMSHSVRPTGQPRHRVSGNSGLRLLLLLLAVLTTAPATSFAQFQKAIRSQGATDRKPQVYCPTIDLNGEPALQRHPVQGESETLVPPLVPPASTPITSPDESTTSPPDAVTLSPLEQMRQERQRKMEDLLRRLQMYQQKVRTGPSAERSAMTDTAESSAATDSVPVPPESDVPVAQSPVESNDVSPSPDSGTGSAPDSGSSDPSPPVLTDAGTELPASEPSDSVKPPADPTTEANDPRKRFSELMDSLTRDSSTQQATEEPPPQTGPGYLAATTVLDSPVDRLRLADNLFATGEVQLALTMYEAVTTKGLTVDDRHWLTYQKACCHRRLGLYGEAESVYRQLAGNSDAGDVSVLSRWWLERLEDRKQLEAQAEQIRNVLSTYREAQASDTTTPQ